MTGADLTEGTLIYWGGATATVLTIDRDREGNVYATIGFIHLDGRPEQDTFMFRADQQVFTP